ncbi:MAG TPA: hypothetical protein VGB67_01065 [Fibrella sp.]|jgi:hypothetical protein
MLSDEKSARKSAPKRGGPKHRNLNQDNATTTLEGAAKTAPETAKRAKKSGKSVKTKVGSKHSPKCHLSRA